MALVSTIKQYIEIGLTWLSPFVWCYLCLLISNWCLGFAVPATTVPTIDLNDLQSSLETIRVANDLPAVAASIVTVDGTAYLATTGFRKRGDETKVTDEDRWHLGSCGKAITATMIARLVERGLLRWDQTLGETFPEFAEKMNAPMKSITLTHLLSHRSGLNANFDIARYQNKTDLMKARHQVVVDAIAKPLRSPPGEKFLYSNWGYTIAAAMAERVTNTPWESLVRTEVFEPLGMSSAGFGGLGTVGAIDQPWPHTANGKAMKSNGPKVDNVQTMGPAGTIHMSLGDWGKFVSEHLRGAKSGSEYLEKATYEKLHTAIGDEYAFGWMSLGRSWAGGKALFHNGDNTMNHAIVWAAPKKGFAVLVAINQSDTGKPADDVAAALIRAWESQETK